MRSFYRKNFKAGSFMRYYTLYNSVRWLQKRHFDRIGVVCCAICPLGKEICFLLFLKTSFAWQLIAVWLLVWWSGGVARIGWAKQWVAAPLETKLKSRDDKKGRLFAESNAFRRKIFVGSWKTPIFDSQIKYIIKRKKYYGIFN